LLFMVGLSYGEDYDRSEHFGSGWVDVDGDCQDTRQEVLIAESLTRAMLDARGCKVMTGEWRCKFTGETFTNPRDLDIDHLVPLKEAWLSGANRWTREQRVAYANDLTDPDHLVAVKAGANRSKGARDPGVWLPEANKVWYINAWWRVKNNYGLTFDAREVRAMIPYMNR
jgi:hypothetical protein